MKAILSTITCLLGLSILWSCSPCDQAYETATVKVTFYLPGECPADIQAAIDEGIANGEDPQDMYELFGFFSHNLNIDSLGNCYLRQAVDFDVYGVGVGTLIDPDENGSYILPLSYHDDVVTFAFERAATDSTEATLDQVVIGYTGEPFYGGENCGYVFEFTDIFIEASSFQNYEMGGQFLSFGKELHIILEE